MARNLSQGLGTTRGAPRSPAPTLELSSVKAQRLTWLEDYLNKVRQTSISALKDSFEGQGRIQQPKNRVDE